MKTFTSIKFEKIQDIETISSIDYDYLLLVDNQIMRLRVKGEQMVIKVDEEEADDAGVFTTLAKGIWGLMGAQETPKPKEDPDEKKFSKLDVHTVKLTTQLNLRAIFAEKDRVFTDFLICKQTNGLL